jgi:uncharacterized protein YprB with RNaseH-like and TPR domain
LLQNTFCHVSGIGPKTEGRLWAQGVLDWNAALCDLAGILPACKLSAAKAARMQAAILTSLARLRAGDARYFSQSLPSHQCWRLFPEFRHSVAYVDIETTGLGGPSDYITTIALYDGGAIYTYVQGQNLDQFARDIAQYKLLVTFNGKTFDVPFIRNDLGIEMPHAHIDLRYVLATLGYRGGLKKCERTLGIDRGELVDVDGYFAVLLWKDYHGRGNQRALETLLAYNVLDVVNLERLMVLAYNQKLLGTPFEASHPLPTPEPPANPFHPDMETVYRLKLAYSYRW